MAASISLKGAKIGGSFLAKTAEYISGAAGDYFKDAMPTTSSIVSDSKSAASTISNTLKSTTSSTLQRVRNMRNQSGLRRIFNWYMQKDENDSFADSDLSFDIDVSDEEMDLATVEMSQEEKNANALANSIRESDQHMLEGQMNLSAMVSTTIDNQTAVITTGFDSVNATLNKVLEVLTKNTATMIEAQMASIGSTVKESESDKMILNHKFSLSSYKDIIAENIKKDPSIGLLSSILPMLTNPEMLKMYLTPDAIIGEGFKLVMDKMVPSLNETLHSIDNGINDVILSFLTKLGENRTNRFGRIFGLDTRRQEAEGSFSKFEVKATQFDTLTREAIVKTIPGYLQKILAALGGEDLEYDFRDRRFKSRDEIVSELRDESAMTNTLNRASERVRKSFGSSKRSDMLYDLLINKLSEESSDVPLSFADPEKFVKYMRDLLKDNNIETDEESSKLINTIAQNLKNSEGYMDIPTQISKEIVSRNNHIQEYFNKAERYGIDLRGISTSNEEDIKTILERQGFTTKEEIPSVEKTESEISEVPLMDISSGPEYANMALYEIFRTLNRGINVFRVGSSDIQTSKFAEETILPPSMYRPKKYKASKVVKPGATLAGMDASGEPNLLLNNEDENGENEDLSKTERLGRWVKTRGGELKRAIISGDPEAIKAAVQASIADVTGVASEAARKGAEKINDSFGNVSGFLKHKLFGSEYKYKDENGQEVKVDENEKGGILGFAKDYLSESFKGTKQRASQWLSEAKSYFNYDNDPDESSSIKSKRNKLISTAIGAMAGGGILGGPIGMLVGGVAGSAISGLDIGDKIKKTLFGRDENGRAKGIFTRLADGVVDPIKYQFEKTLHGIGNSLKKNIVGPLSDIGYAIKERIKEKADTTFGKVFSFIGKAIAAPFKGVGKLILGTIKAPINAIGGLVRGGAEISTGVVGAGLTTIADTIGGGYFSDTRKELRERRKQRSKDVKADKFESYKDWKTATDQRRAEVMSKFDQYVAEATSKTEENTATIAGEASKMSETVGNMAETAETTRDATVSLKDMAEDENCIYVHEQGIRDRLDRIIDLMGRSDVSGENPLPDLGNIDQVSSSVTNIIEDRNEAVNSIAGQAATIAGMGDLTSEEQKEILAINKEASNENSNPEVATSHLTKVMKSANESKEDREKKSTSLWDLISGAVSGIGSTISNILGGIGDILPILAAVGAGVALVSQLLENFDLGQTISHLSDSILNGIHDIFFGDEDESTDASDEGVNAALALTDTHVETKWDLANPFATMYHNQQDANGNYIEDQGKTGAKTNYQFTVPLLTRIVENANTMREAATMDIKAAEVRNTGIEYYKQSAEAAANAGKAQVAAEQANALAESRQGTIAGDRYAAHSEMKINEYETYHEQAAESYKAGQAAMEESKDLSQQAEETRTNVNQHAGSQLARETATNFARVGIMDIAGKGTGAVTEMALEKVGLNEETSNKVGNIVNRGTTAALLIDQGVSAITPGKTSIVDTILKGLKAIFNKLAKVLKADKLLKSFGDKIDKFFDGIYNKTVGKLTGELAEAVAKKMLLAMGKEATPAAVEQLASALTAGVVTVVAAIIGIVSGVCGTEHLFGVMPGEADGTMKAISGILKGAFSAAETIPGWGLIFAGFDVLDEFVFKNILVDRNGLGHTLKSYIAMFCYGLIEGEAGKERLIESQNMLNAEREYYNNTYGANVDLTAFNDMVNRDGIINTIMHGKAQYAEDGHLYYDKAGELVEGGLTGWATGGEKRYMTDEEGNVLRGADGKAIEVRDEEGNIMTVNNGGEISKMWNAVTSAFTGQDIYETDQLGNAIVDENGNYVVAEHKEGGWTGFKNLMSENWDIMKRETGLVASNTFKSIKDLPQVIKKLGGYMKNGDIVGLISDKSYKEDGSPLSGVGKVMYAINKVSFAPFTLLTALGKKVAEFATNAGNKAGTASTALINSHYALNGYQLNGDPEGLMAMTIQDDPENPVGGITNAIFTIDKLLSWPGAALVSVGNKIKKKFVDMANTASDAKLQLDRGVEQIHSKAAIGDVSGLHDLKYEEAENNPLNGLMSGLFNITKIFNYPAAGIHWMGNKIKDKFDEMTSTISSNRETLDKGTNDVMGLAADGDIKGVWDSNISFKPGDPLAGIWTISYGITKLIGLILATINTIGTKANELYENTIGWADDLANNATGNNTTERGSIHDEGGGARGGAIEGVGGGNGDWSGMPTNVQQQLGVQYKSAESNKANLTGNPLNKSFKITSAYGQRTTPRQEFHKGIDIIPNDGSGSADLVSTIKGTVIGVKNDVQDSVTAKEDPISGRYSFNYPNEQSTGNMVTLKANDGTIVKYMHIKHGSIPSAIKEGATVNVATKLGTMGSTGFSTGPHLHYQMETASGSPFNPTTYAKSTKSTEERNGDYNGMPTDVQQRLGIQYKPSKNTSITATENAYTDTSYSSINTTSTEQSPQGLAALLTKIKEFGTQLLFKVTGGLFGSNTSNGSTTMYGSSSLGYNNTTEVGNAKEFIEMIAKEVGTSENPPNSNNVKYNTWYYGKEVSGSAYPWCMAFVQWCFNNAGLTLPYKTAACQTLLDWYNEHDPARVHTTNPKPGDIIIFGKQGKRAGHTGIVTGSDQTYVYTIEGNTSSTSTEFESNGGCVANKKHKWTADNLKAFITAVDFETLQKTQSTVSNSISYTGDDNNVEDLWRYFKKLGYSDKATAAILGAWMSESKNEPRTIEGDYLKYFNEYGGYNMVDDQASMDAYTQRLFQSYADKGLSINHDIYKVGDHYYPGLGMAQWTGGRAKALLDFAKQNNKDWKSRATQLEYLSTELAGSYSSVRNSIENAADVNEATKIFTKKFEGSSRGIEGRQAHARALYDQYAGKYVESTPMSFGGPLDINDTNTEVKGSIIKDPNTGRILEIQAPVFDNDPDINTPDYSPKPSAPMGGGIEDSTPSFRSVEYVPRVRPTQKLDVGGPLEINDTNTPVIKSVTRTNPVVNETQPAQVVQQTDLTAITALATRMIEELVKITNNTASSSDLLGSLNEKDFVDKGLRDSINALGQARKAQRSTQLPSSSASMALNMAKP